MSAHLIDTSDDESLLVVANYICQLIDGQARSELVDTAGSAFYKECHDALANGEFRSLLSKFIEQIDLIFEKASSSGDAETAICVIVHLLKALPEGQHSDYALKLASAVAAKEDDHAEQRLSILTDVFNATADPKAQYRVLLLTVKLAKASSKATILAPALRGNLDTWVKAWNLSREDERHLLFAVADLFRAQTKRKVLQKEAYRLQARALSTFEVEETQKVTEAKQIAINTIADFINSPDVFQFDLLQNPAIKQLESDSSSEALLSLLNSVLSGDIKEVDQILQSDSSLQQTYKFSTSDIIAKAQLMALINLAAQSNELSYQVLQERLGLDDDDAVEEWLVKAIGKRLIQGQMDQEKRAVTISKATQRTFGRDDWKLLQRQIKSWAENVKNVQELIASGDALGLNGAHPGQSWGQSGRSDSQFRRPVQT